MIEDWAIFDDRLVMAWTRTWRIGTQDECVRIAHALYHLSGGCPMVDLGCRSAQLTRDLRGTWVEVDPQPDTPKEAIIMDLRAAPLKFASDKQSFNLMILTDVIEHLERKDAITLLQEMSSIANGYLIFTPVGFLSLPSNGDAHTHRSGWCPEEFFSNGYTIWEWPVFHPLIQGAPRGAFWAWKLKGRTFSVEDVAYQADVKI